MKQLNLLKTLFLLCALVVGSSSAWADETADWSYTVVSSDASKLDTENKTFTVDATHVFNYDVTVAAGSSPSITVANASGKSGIKFGESAKKYYNPVILSTDAFSDKAVTKVSLCLKHNGAKVGTLTVKQGSTTIGTATTSSTSDWITVTCSETNKGAGGTLEIKYEVAQALYINKIEVWYDDLGTATTTTIDASGITNTDIYLGTAAGSLSASVTEKVGGSAVGGATVSWSSSDEAVATIASDGKVTLKRKGSTTITASYAGDATYAASFAEYVLTVTNSAPQETDIIVATNYEWLGVEEKSSITGPTVIDCEGVNVTVDEAEGSTAPRGDDTYIRLYAKNTLKFEAPANYVITEIIFTKANSKWDNSFNVDAGSWDNTELKWNGAAKEITLTEAGSSGNNQFSQMEIKLAASKAVTITDAKYATYVNESVALDFSATGITAYTATAGATSVTLNEIASGKVPANTPVVLYKSDADGTPIDVPVVASAEAVGANDLVKSTGGTPSNAYVLAKKSGVVGFYKWAGGSITSGKVYLQASTSAPEFLGFGDDTTGINEVAADKTFNGEFFNLAGQRVAQPTKGLYIVNGKKVIIK